MKACRVIAAGYGAPAISALREVLTEIKRDDLLAPATVLVPNNIAGVIARRALAAGVRPGRPGIAGVQVTTLSRLAEQLAAPLMSPRTPATRAAIAAAWRVELDYGTGPFAAVRDHPATIRALTAAHRELRELTADEMRTVESGGRLARDLVTLHRRVTDRVTATSYDTVDLLHAAAEAVAERPEMVSGAYVLYLPQQLTPSEISLAQAIANGVECTVILGLTGVQRADTAVRESVAAITGQPLPDGPRPPTANRVLHHSDSDDEVRGIVHEVLDALADTPAHRIAIFYAQARPYPRLLHEQLTAAGVLVNGPGVVAVDERAISRGLLGVLALGPDLPRAEAFRALSEAPTRDPANGRRIPIARWERISRMAGVVGGPDWDQRLHRFADDHRAAAEESDEHGGSDARIRDADDATALSAFAAGLGRRLADGAALTSWPALASWTLELFRDLYGTPADLAQLPPDERYAAAVIEQTLPRLSSLATHETHAELALLVEVLTEELRSARPRVGRFGEGVFVGPVSAAIGMSADTVFVLGLSEDTYPGATHVEALLPDRIRDVVPGLPGRRDRLDGKHRELLVALMSANQVVASFARGDLRRNTLRLPSRWLLPTLRELTGDQRLAATRWSDASSRNVVGGPSYAATLGRSPRPATGQEWRVRAVATGHELDPVAAAAVDLLTARAGSVFTRYDGNLSAAAVLPDPGADGVLLSATRLESYALCPHTYFVQRLLRVQPLEQPEEIIVISPLDIGSLMHEAMEEFVRHEVDRLPGYGQPWTASQRDHLIAIGAAKALEFETRGVTGHRLLWTAERTRILADLRRMLDDDNQWRAGLDARVVASELTFGSGDLPPVTLRLPSGRTIRLRGSADKVDQARDGTLLVTDLKTGGPGRFAVLRTDPIAAGTKLQLPLYAFAARDQMGEHPVLAQYWFVRKGRRLGGPERIAVRLDAEVQARYLAALDVLVDGIATGLFPARAPDQPDFGWVQCAYCNPDGLGHRAARDRWERRRADPLLHRYVALVEPPDAS
jgi:ATP-dependent helicase/nuclease subunit B